MPVRLCLKCFNIGATGHKCTMCGRQRKVSQSEINLQEIRKQKDKERYQFLSKMQQKMDDLNMTTTGSFEVDATIKEELGG